MRSPSAPDATHVTDLSSDELQRYARQMRLPQLGLAGQERLKSARVLVVGAGGLGSPAAIYLAAAGIGTLGVVDSDHVEASNLHRQPLHGTGDVGRPKVASAEESLRRLNPHVEVRAWRTRLHSENALEIIGEHDLVVDGSDNFPTRYLVSDACVLLGKPFVYGSVDRFDGQVSVFGAPGGPCYRCLFPEPPPPGTVQSCADAGVLGVLPGLVGTLQAIEALKLVLGLGDALVGRLLLIDALRMRFQSIAVQRDPACPACGTREIRALIDYDAFCAGDGHGVAAADTAASDGDITPAQLSARLATGDAPVLLDVRELHEWAYARIAGARLVPLGQLEQSLATLDPRDEIVVYCHHGTRSAYAADRLRAAGFARVRNLTGGIDRWSTEVDPSVPRY